MKSCWFISLICIPFFSIGQKNLVPNGDFEGRTKKDFPCSWLVDDGNLNQYIYDWFTPIGTTTDLMSAYAEDDCWAQTPNTGEGKMAPHSGNVMVGFINYSPDGGCVPNEWHEYLSVELTEPLTPGNLYCVEFWVALGANSNYATNNIGALLTTESPERSSCEPILNTPQVNITRVINNTQDWLRVEASFLADSAYRYLTIGNFFLHDATIIEQQKSNPAQQPQGTPPEDNNENIISDDVSLDTVTPVSDLAYYFIDDVRLYLCPSVRVDTYQRLQLK